MNQDLLESVKKCPALPTMPTVAMQILEIARNPEVDIQDIADLVSNDPALSSKVLKTVNSSFYGLSKSVGTISQAVVILGLQSVKTLALGFSLVGGLNKTHPEGFDHMQYWRRSIYGAVASRIIAERMKLVQTEEAFLAGLLQDIGMLALYAHLESDYGRVCKEAGSHRKLAGFEAERLELDHAAVGAALTEDWSLPPMLTVPIGCHHDPDQAEDTHRPLAQVVQLSSLFAEVFMDNNEADAIQVARDGARHLLGFDEEEVDKQLQLVGKSTREVANLFEVNIGKQTDYQTILAQAREAMLEMTLQSHQLAARLQDKNAELTERATTDPMTGVANRAKFDSALAEEFSRAKKFLRPISVLFIDADHFKGLNDTFGHEAGDVALKRIASLLQRACRKVDLVGRLGGEEFGCLLNETDLVGAAQLGEAIRLTIAEEAIDYEGQRLPVTVSVGVASMEQGAFFESPQALVKAADRAMYAAKKSGRNMIRIFNAKAAAAARKQ